MVDKFISAVKGKRDEALEVFTSEVFLQEQASGDPQAVIAKGLDQLVSNILDVVEEQYQDIVTGNATDGEGEEVSVDLVCATDLSTLYMEEVNT